MQDKPRQIFVPPYISELDPYKPGKSSDIETFGRYKAILCSNENNLGPSPKAMKAIVESLKEIYAYPDPGGQKVVQKLSEIHHVKDENIILSNGLDGLLYTLFKAFTLPGDEVITSNYSFVAFDKFSKMNNVILKKAEMSESYTIDLVKMLNLISKKTRIIYICNPNNPTGTALQRAKILDFIANIPTDILIVFDEAYIEFAKAKDKHFFDSLDQKFDNVLTLRTLSKVYGLAGLRIGYGIGSSYVISALNKVKLVFNPNTLAQVAAFAALDDKDHLGSTLENNTFWKLSVEKILEEKEIRYLDSYTNFITLVFDSSQKASAYNEYMDKEGVLLRKLDGFGLSHGVRISIGNPDEMSHCVKCLSNYSIE